MTAILGPTRHTPWGASSLPLYNLNASAGCTNISLLHDLPADTLGCGPTRNYAAGAPRITRSPTVVVGRINWRLLEMPRAPLVWPSKPIDYTATFETPGTIGSQPSAEHIPARLT